LRARYCLGCARSPRKTELIEVFYEATRISLRLPDFGQHYDAGQSNPIPLINQPMVPASATPGGNAFTLTINGTGFTSTAAVYWNGSLRPTTVVSNSTVQAQISAADIVKPGFGWVTVGNLGTGEVQSNVVYFPIRASAKGVGFLPRSIQNVATSPGPIAVGDFNNDGFLDFAVSSKQTIQVFLGKGNGTFQLPVTTSTLKYLPLSIVSGDFNGDGNLDLAVLEQYLFGDCCYPHVFLGKGDGTFAPLNRLHLHNWFELSAADFNGDGNLDLYILESQGGDCLGRHCFGILLGNGDGTFKFNFCCDGPVPNGTGYPAIADFNGDGKLDMAVSGLNRDGKGIVDVFLGDGTGRFANRVTYLVPFGGDSVAAADVNGDGKIDLVTDGVSVLLGNGDGTFRRGASIASGGSGSVNVGDFNGDGKLDVATGLSMLLGNGNGTFQKPLTFAGTSSGFPISMGAFNGNGNLDLLGINALNGTLSIFDQRPLYFTPTNLDFGSQGVGTTSPPQTASLTNFGAKKLVISSINITGSNSADFAQGNNCGLGLPSNKSCQSQVTFTPSLVGNESASLNVTYQGSAPLSMPLSGIGADQTFTVTLTPSSLTFATQLVGTASAPQPATLTNTGNQPVTISNIVATAPFSQTNNCPSTLLVGGSCQINVRFSPTDKGTANGTLSVTDDAVGSPQKVTLLGTGTVVVLSPTAINFGNQKVGTSSVPVPVTLSNVGPSSLSITQIAIKGADPNDFSQTNDCGNSVPPHSHCTITVTFTPTATGARSAKVSISDDDPTSPQSVPLSGRGT
jgi:hypothetical protein